MTDSLSFFFTFEASKQPMEKAHLSMVQKGVLMGLFLIFLIVTAISYDDYGIAWDEPNQKEIGKFNYDYLLGTSDSLKQYHDRYYGAAYEMPVYALTKIFNLENTPSEYHFRHLINHLLFILSLAFFFALLFKLFKNFHTAIFGTLILYLHPRIFAHSFFNSKDLVFLSFFIIGLYTLFLVFENQTKKRILLHALATAFLIDIRIIGIILPFISLLVMLPNLFKASEYRKQSLKSLTLYSILSILFIYLFWPALWTDPFLLGKSFLRMSHFPFRYDVLFQGALIPATQIPWSYIPVWIGISTPPFILLFIILGFVWLIRDYIKNPESAFFTNKQWFILVIATFPIDFSILLIIINSTLYDGWRQVFFLYPMILLAAIYAFHHLMKKLENKRFWKIFTYTLISVFIILTVKKIIYLHPYEQVYFNHFVSKKDENRRKSFEMDYWGLSYREGIAYVLNHDNSKKISICFANAAGENNLLCFSDEEQARIVIKEKPEMADYFITNYRYHPENYKYTNEVFKVERDENHILSVFKMTK